MTGQVQSGVSYAFIGLQRDWGWSPSDSDDYKEGELAYWNWASGEPMHHYCGSIGKTGEWFAASCFNHFKFFCYHGENTRQFYILLDLLLILFCGLKTNKCVKKKLHFHIKVTHIIGGWFVFKAPVNLVFKSSSCHSQYFHMNQHAFLHVHVKGISLHLLDVSISNFFLLNSCHCCVYSLFPLPIIC